jgi:hypothetical protein
LPRKATIDPKRRNQASRLRQELLRLHQEAARLLEVFLSHAPMVRGSVYQLRRTCGKPTCACVTKGRLHICTAITWSADGRKRLRSLSPKEELEMKRLTEAYRLFRQARARLVDIQTRMLETIDAIDAIRRRDP